MGQSTLMSLLIVALESGADETGLSKGPADPAELGTRCSVMAGREDRGYLDCGRQAPSASRAKGVTPAEQSRTDSSTSGSDGTARRYPVRTR
jgi:hypothetical protein